MASTPSFAATPKLGSGLVHATFDTSLTAPTNVTTIVTGAASGTKIEELIFQGVGTTVASVVNVFVYDSGATTYHLIDQVLVSAVTSSTTALAFRSRKQYQNLLLPSTSYSVRVTNTVAGNQSMIKVTAFGADF